MNAERWAQIKAIFHDAAELSAAERAAYIRTRCPGDEQLALEIEALISAQEQNESFIESPALHCIKPSPADDGYRDAGKLIGPYRVIRKIGSGGMGLVYLAERADQQFEKQVAIKLIRQGLSEDFVVHRFVRERQMLARLEHPNIARLVDGGTTEESLPYLVMEYVEGKSITNYSSDEDLPTGERLKLFRLVCAAVHHAHQNLIVHRDIKPANILVSPDGEPKLLDFGIAKLLSPGAEDGQTTTLFGRLMTPDYASPEQAKGEPITTASDVYSLGVLLYELLTGLRPYRITTGSALEIAQVICAGEPNKPSAAVERAQSAAAESDSKGSSNELARDLARLSKLRRQLEGDLDNIILKAMSKEPERRYSSAQEFSEDIRRHIEGLPVTARPATFSYRASKFVARHKAGVAAGALVIIAVVGGVVTTLWQAHAARQERDKAERRFNQVRKLANSVLFEYHDGIVKLAGSTTIREKMVKDALEYLDNLSTESSGDPALQAELATAYEKVGDVQGNPYGANLGNLDGALESYRKAVIIREAVAAANGTDAKVNLDLGNSYRKTAEILWAKGQNDVALPNYHKALATFEELVNDDPKNAEYLKVVYLTLNGIAHVQAQNGDFKGALDTYRKCLENAEALQTADPTGKDNVRRVGIARLKVGDTLMDLADYAGALTQYEKSVEVLSRVAASAQNNAAAARDLGLSYARIASAYMDLEDYEKAVEFHLKAIEQQEQVVAADPNNVQSHFDVAATYANLSDTYFRIKKLDNAAMSVREAIRISTEALSKNPDYLQGQDSLGRTYLTYADVLLARGDANPALENYRKALNLLEREPIRSAQTVALANAYAGLGNTDLLRASQVKGEVRRVELFKAAQDWYQKSFQVWQGLVQQGKVTGESRTNLSEITQKIERCRAALMKLKSGQLARQD